MNASELRIGNLFLYENCIYIAKVIRVDFIYGINRNGFAPGEFPIEVIKPIPITSEILLACGFENKIRGNYYHKEFTKLYVNIDNSIAIHFGNKNGILKLIDYLHELQNIFWILTNQELEIQL
jgi:hypothetical protein